MRIIGAIPDKTKVSKEVWDEYIESIENHIPTKQDKVNYKLMKRKLNQEDY